MQRGWWIPCPKCQQTIELGIVMDVVPLPPSLQPAATPNSEGQKPTKRPKTSADDPYSTTNTRFNPGANASSTEVLAELTRELEEVAAMNSKKQAEVSKGKV